MSYLEENYPEYDCDIYGNVYCNGEVIKPFKSNKYYQVLLFDKNHTRHVAGVHVVVAMKFLNYYKGCVVHHKNGDTHDNNVDNLEVKSRSEHSSEHSAGHRVPQPNGPWNKGKKMNEEYRKKCSEGAKKRLANKKTL